MIKCRAYKCPREIRNKCLRYTTIADWSYQKYYVDVNPDEKGKCKMFVNNKPE